MSHRHVKSLGQGTGQRAATHLHEKRIEFHLRPPECLGHLERKRSTALNGEAIFSALHAKGNGPGHDRFAETQEARITLFANSTLANGDRRAETLEPVHNNLTGIRRDEHVDRPICSPCNHGGRQRGVATGGDRQAAMPQAFGDRQACRRNHTQIQHDTHQMPGLM